MAEIQKCECGSPAVYFVWYENCGGMYNSKCLEHLKVQFANEVVTGVRAIQDAAPTFDPQAQNIPTDLAQEIQRWRERHQTGQLTIHFKDGVITAATLSNNLKFATEKTVTLT